VLVAGKNGHVSSKRWVPPALPNRYLPARWTACRFLPVPTAPPPPTTRGILPAIFQAQQHQARLLRYPVPAADTRCGWFTAVRLAEVATRVRFALRMTVARITTFLVSWVYAFAGSTRRAYRHHLPTSGSPLLHTYRPRHYLAMTLPFAEHESRTTAPAHV